MPTTKPIVITSISGTGPMMALDVSTVPEALKLRIVQAAIHACVYIGNGEIEADGECTVADEALDDLVTAVDALDELHQPVIPGSPYMTIGDTVSGNNTYPIIRDGLVVQMHRADLTPFEKLVVESWLRMRGMTALNHADELAATAIPESAEA